MLRLSSKHESWTRYRHGRLAVGDPAHANMLTALMTSRALTTSELAREAGITPQTDTNRRAFS
jgi:hypothetical protein